MEVEIFLKRCRYCASFAEIETSLYSGLCIQDMRYKGHDQICAYPDKFEPLPNKGDSKMIKFGELLPLIKCEFVVEYKGEIYHSFGNTLQSVLRKHFKDLTVKELTTYDEECLKVVIK